MTETIPTPRARAEARDKPGKTFADVLDNMLNHPKKFFAALGMFAAIILLSVLGAIGGVAILNRYFGLSFSKVEVSTLGNQITLRTTSGTKQSTLIMVHPQGWEDTGIKVHKGEIVNFNAEGKVSIDGYSLVKAYKLLGDLEDSYRERVRKASSHLRDDEQKTPEQFYSSELSDVLNKCLRRLWTEPDGFDAKYYLPGSAIGDCPEFSKLGGPHRYDPPTAHPDISYDYPDQDFPGRTQHKLMPNEPYGKLIGAVRVQENGHDPKTLETFPIGKSHQQGINQDGELWLVVNDVVDEKDKEESKYFYYDNVGFFIVNIQTEKN